MATAPQRRLTIFSNLALSSLQFRNELYKCDLQSGANAANGIHRYTS
jgi:hypothetical protein